MLAHKQCLITGASRGIGEAISLAYAKERAKLLLVSRNQRALDAAGERCRRAGAPVCDTFAADLSVRAEVNKVANVYHALIALNPATASSL